MMFAGFIITFNYGVVGGGRLYMGVAVLLAGAFLGVVPAVIVLIFSLVLVLTIGGSVLGGQLLQACLIGNQRSSLSSESRLSTRELRLRTRAGPAP